MNQNLNLKISINLNPLLIKNQKLPNHLKQRVSALGISPSAVTLEVTKQHLTQNPIITLKILTQLQLMGFEVSLDDFGSGYTGLEQLQRYPFTELKIDRGLVRMLSLDPRARDTIAAGVELGRSQGLEVVAEGIKSPEN